MARAFLPLDVVRMVTNELMREDDERRRTRADRESVRVDLSPASAYEAVTRQMVEALADDLREIKRRLDGLLWMVAGAIVIDIVIRLSGAGS
jgi:hypothetical protein